MRYHVGGPYHTPMGTSWNPYLPSGVLKPYYQCEKGSSNMKTLDIRTHRVPLHEQSAKQLKQDGLLYPCEICSAYHLVPDNEHFTLENVERICLAIVSDQTPWEKI